MHVWIAAPGWLYLPDLVSFSVKFCQVCSAPATGVIVFEWVMGSPGSINISVGIFFQACYVITRSVYFGLPFSLKDSFLVEESNPGVVVFTAVPVPSKGACINFVAVV